MTSPFPIDAPELIGIGAQSIVDRAKPLGLIWTRRLATVMDGTLPQATVILFDADTVNTVAVSMLGVLPIGARVYVDMVPPSANFITGVVASLEAPVLFGAPVNLNAALAAGTTVSAFYANMPGSPTVTLDKGSASTSIRVDLHASLFSTLANTEVRLAVNINGTTDGDTVNFFINAANTHVQLASVAIFPFASVGSIPIIARWRRVSGGGTLTTNANDWISLAATEVPA